jgi:hypothetical protein
MNDFKKRVLAIKELYPEVTANSGNTALDNEGNVVTVDETAITNKIAEMDTVREAETQAKEDLKASAKAKLIAGEALTQEEADTIVL